MFAFDFSSNRRAPRINTKPLSKQIPRTQPTPLTFLLQKTPHVIVTPNPKPRNPINYRTPQLGTPIPSRNTSIFPVQVSGDNDRHCIAHSPSRPARKRACQYPTPHPRNISCTYLSSPRPTPSKPQVPLILVPIKVTFI